MTEYAFIVDLAKQVGFAALIFVIWYFTAKWGSKFITDMMNQHKETNAAVLAEMKESNRAYVAAMKDQTDSVSLIFTRLKAVEFLINNNQFCPMARSMNKAKMEKLED